VSLRLTQETLHLSLRDPFRIARAEHRGGHSVTTVIVELRDDRFPGVVGVGEGYPDRYYGETPETMAAVLPLLADAIGEPASSEAGLVAAELAMDAVIRGHGAAKCALDIALHDLIGKVTGTVIRIMLTSSRKVPRNR